MRSTALPKCKSKRTPHIIPSDRLCETLKQFHKPEQQVYCVAVQDFEATKQIGTSTTKANHCNILQMETGEKNPQQDMKLPMSESC